jgi:hypothetical protein
MTAHPINLARPETAAVVRDQVAALLASIAAVRETQAAAHADGLSEAGEALAVEALVVAEDHLVAVALRPGLAEFLECLVDQLAAIAEGRPCA